MPRYCLVRLIHLLIRAGQQDEQRLMKISTPRMRQRTLVSRAVKLAARRIATELGLNSGNAARDGRVSNASHFPPVHPALRAETRRLGIL